MDVSRRIRIGLKRLTYGRTGGDQDGERVVAWLDLEPGMKVADIGAGFGDFAVRFARAVGPLGAVYAVDTDADLRDEVGRRAQELDLAQLAATAATPDDPGVPEPVDLVFLSWSFHHLPDRVGYFTRVGALLRPGGRVAVLEGRPGLLTGWMGHSTRPADVQSTLEAAGFRRLDSADLVRGASLQAFGLDADRGSADPSQEPSDASGLPPAPERG